MSETETGDFCLNCCRCGREIGGLGANRDHCDGCLRSLW